jgi:glyoxylate carboligase
LRSQVCPAAAVSLILRAVPCPGPWGARHVFGYPGDEINGAFGALNRADGKVRFIQARHEEMSILITAGSSVCSTTRISIR